MAVPDTEALVELYPGLLLYAARWARLCALGHSAEDLVQTAVESLFRGACPDGVAPAAFLKMKIRQLATNERRHHSLLPMRSLSDASQLAKSPEAEGLELHELAGQVARRIEALARAAGDEEVLRVLAAMEDGHEKRREIAAAAGLSPTRLDAAKRRMFTLLAKLPPELLASSEEAMGSA